MAFVILDGRGVGPHAFPHTKPTGRWCSFLLLVPLFPLFFSFSSLFLLLSQASSQVETLNAGKEGGTREGEPAEPPSPRGPEGSKAEQWGGQKGVSLQVLSHPPLAPGRPVKAGPSTARLLSEP